MISPQSAAVSKPTPPDRRLIGCCARAGTAALQERWALTPQEARVALLIADEMTNRQIAEAMGLSPATTRHFTESVCLELGVHSRAQATAKVLGS